MPFNKDDWKGNRDGRPKGSKDKKTLEWEQFGKEILSVGLLRAKSILAESNDKEYMVYFLQLLEYFKPKQHRTDLNVKNDGVLTVIHLDENNTSYTPQLPKAGSEGVQEI